MAFERVSLAAGESTVVRFTVPAERFSTVSLKGTRHILPGEFTLLFSRGHGVDVTAPLQLHMDAPMIVSKMVV